MTKLIRATLALAVVLGTSIVAWATEEPAAGGYHVFRGGAIVGEAEVQSPHGPIEWIVDGEYDIFVIDPPNCRYLSPASGNQLVFTPRDGGGYHYTHGPGGNELAVDGDVGYTGFIVPADFSPRIPLRLE